MGSHEPPSGGAPEREGGGAPQDQEAHGAPYGPPREPQSPIGSPSGALGRHQFGKIRGARGPRNEEKKRRPTNTLEKLHTFKRKTHPK